MKFPASWVRNFTQGATNGQTQDQNGYGQDKPLSHGDSQARRKGTVEVVPLTSQRTVRDLVGQGSLGNLAH